ncbi:MAG: hypothetical protein E7554_05945 [Ruminococcaceae bacterium]|nr:hypothetical protein [Oscillospiraceae bacterium]
MSRKIIVDFNKFYAMSKACSTAADTYRGYIAQLKTLVSSLGVMKEPSLSVGIEHINDLIGEMSKSASDLDAIADRLNSNLATLKRMQDSIENAAKNLGIGN